MTKIGKAVQIVSCMHISEMKVYRQYLLIDVIIKIKFATHAYEYEIIIKYAKRNACTRL